MQTTVYSKDKSWYLMCMI